MLDAGFLANHRQSFALSTVTAGQVNLSVTGSAANLNWTGGGSNTWNVNNTANWDNSGSGDKFYQTDSVTFTDAGDSTVPVAVSGTVNAGAFNVNATENYTFTGGAIAGGGAFTKSNTGSLTFLNDLTAGAMNISGGAVTFGNGGTTGGLLGTGTVTLAGGTTLTMNRSDATSFTRAFAAGSTGTLIKEGAGNLTIGGAFQLLPTTLTVNTGTLTVANGSFSGNRMEGNGLVTINPSGTLVLAAGSAHSFGGNNTTMTESFVINGGTLTVNQEQYFNNLTLNGGLVNGTADIRSANASNWLVTGTTASTVTATVTNQNNTNWNVGDVTSSGAVDLQVSGNITGAGATNKAGLGTLRATGNNNFSGAVAITAGTFQAGSNNALGFGSAIGNTAVNGTTVTGATLDINGVTVNEAVTLNGGKLINSNTVTAGTLASGIAGIRVSTVGSGYTSAPTVAFSGGGGSGATATTALSTTTVGSVTTTAAGSGYTTAPTVTLTGGVGTGATATALISSLALTGTANEIGGDGNLNVNAIMTGAGGYTKTGGGILTLGTGGSTFTGNVAVNAGTLNATTAGNAATSAFGSQSNTRTISINNGAVVNFNTNNIIGPGGTAPAALPTFAINAGSSLTTNNYNVLGAVNLNGGTLTVNRTGTPTGYQGFELKGAVTTGGSGQSVITGTNGTGTNGWGHHLVGNITFDVGEAVPGTDLLVSAPLRNSSADNGSAVASLTKNGAGTMELSGVSTYTGTTTVTNGTLRVSGAIGNGNVLVDTLGTLSGGSSVAGILGGMVTVSGTLAPGSSPGTLSIGGNLLLNNTAALNWEINSLSPLTLGSGVNDLVTVGGLLTLDGTLNVSGIGSFSGVNTGTWTLLTYGSLLDNTLSLGTLPTLDPGLSWELSSGSGQVNLAIVPEPGSAMLGTLGLLFFLRRRR